MLISQETNVSVAPSAEQILLMPSDYMEISKMKTILSRLCIRYLNDPDEKNVSTDNDVEFFHNIMTDMLDSTKKYMDYRNKKILEST